ncbi:hypothetical protein [Dasania marina]|uniref:hypothetical protein n=1 Tax=Dasania marina TaxID=471499 RepID=UPI00037AAC81|nr:hypothetical protein [Dasania marina]
MSALSVAKDDAAKHAAQPLTAKQCDKPVREQIAVVAEFHVYRIHPARIAFRTGIALDLIQSLLSGEHEPKFFQHCIRQAKQAKRANSLQASLRLRGASRKQLQDNIEAEFVQPLA